MKYPTNDDEIAKSAIMSWFTDQYDGDEEAARKAVKMSLAMAELRERGFGWTDI
jgi:hypothetical protein